MERRFDPISEEKLAELVSDGAMVECCGDELTLTLPWHFGLTAEEGTEPLVITVRRVKPPKKNTGPLRQSYGGGVVDMGNNESYELSDGGRAISELARRVDKLSDYSERIEKILRETGMHTLRGGRIITKIFELYGRGITAWELDGFITAVTTVANLDILPPFAESKWSSNRNI